MEVRSVSCIVVLLVALVVTNVRTMEPVSTHRSASQACDICSLVSRKVEATLNRSELFDEVHLLLEEACNVFPTIVREKCLKKSGDYMHEAWLVLQDFLAEDHLCNGSGLCAKSEFPVASGLFMDEIHDELEGKIICGACKNTVKNLLNWMMKKWVKTADAALNFCKEAGEFEDECKRAIYWYGRIILHHLEILEASVLCSEMGMCSDVAEEMAVEYL